MQKHTKMLYNVIRIECDTKLNNRKKPNNIAPCFIKCVHFMASPHLPNCHWNAFFEHRFKWINSNGFSQSKVMNVDQNWHFHGCYSIILKRFSIQDFYLTFQLVVSSHLVQKFSFSISFFKFIFCWSVCFIMEVVFSFCFFNLYFFFVFFSVISIFPLQESMSGNFNAAQRTF